MRRGWEVAYRLELEKQASGAVWVEGLPAFSRCAGESGKSTIVKQMRILHVNGFNAEWLDWWFRLLDERLMNVSCSRRIKYLIVMENLHLVNITNTKRHDTFIAV
nr:PREDICTED: uncharacterized protein LOC104141253 isoform X1 [Struthio camelus australis]